jgi:hypothetical protein
VTPVPPDPLGQPVRFDDARAADPIARYLREMARVCPFIEPSEKAGCLYASQVTLDCRAAEDIHPRMFEQLVPAIERYRERRRALPDKNERLLLSQTLVFHLPAHLEAEANRLMAWPNWLGALVKHLYTPKSIIFGFIRKGVAERSSLGEPIPVAPFHAVVIRSRVIGSDQRFFAGNDAWLSALAEGTDDGTDVHAGLLHGTPDLRDPAALSADNYFHRLRAWGQAQFRQ